MLTWFDWGEYVIWHFGPDESPWTAVVRPSTPIASFSPINV